MNSFDNAQSDSCDFDARDAYEWEYEYDGQPDEVQEYEYDGQPDEVQEWYDFDPDC